MVETKGVMTDEQAREEALKEAKHGETSATVAERAEEIKGANDKISLNQDETVTSRVMGEEAGKTEAERDTMYGTNNDTPGTVEGEELAEDTNPQKKQDNNGGTAEEAAEHEKPEPVEVE